MTEERQCAYNVEASTTAKTVMERRELLFSACLLAVGVPVILIGGQIVRQIPMEVTVQILQILLPLTVIAAVLMFDRVRRDMFDRKVEILEGQIDEKIRKTQHEVQATPVSEQSEKQGERPLIDGQKEFDIAQDAEPVSPVVSDLDSGRAVRQDDFEANSSNEVELTISDIKTALVRLERNQTELAEAVGVSRFYISKILVGNKKLTADLQRKIAGAIRAWESER